jgi:UDP-3-O-[3-hydroxymyristoyl] glucosamine N-acyltransferase
MVNKISFSFNSLDINRIILLENLHINKEITISTVSSINNPENNSLMFIKRISEDVMKSIRSITGCIIFIPIGMSIDADFGINNLIIPSENPRMDFALVFKHILASLPADSDYITLANGSILGKDTVIGEKTVIEPQVFIDNNVSIGDRCVIMSGCKIRSNVAVGSDTILHDNCVIGGQGLGVERDLERDVNIMIPHIGGVAIGDSVELGALSTVASGTIDPTIIDNQVKTDRQVVISHNCRIGKGVLIGASAVFCGSVRVGDHCWIGPNATVIDNISIGKDAFIALGSVVLRNIKESEVVAGNPARQFTESKQK